MARLGYHCQCEKQMSIQSCPRLQFWKGRTVLDLWFVSLWRSSHQEWECNVVCKVCAGLTLWWGRCNPKWHQRRSGAKQWRRWLGSSCWPRRGIRWRKGECWCQRKQFRRQGSRFRGWCRFPTFPRHQHSGSRFHPCRRLAASSVTSETWVEVAQRIAAVLSLLLLCSSWYSEELRLSTRSAVCVNLAVTPAWDLLPAEHLALLPFLSRMHSRNSWPLLLCLRVLPLSFLGTSHRLRQNRTLGCWWRGAIPWCCW